MPSIARLFGPKSNSTPLSASVPSGSRRVEFIRRSDYRVRPRLYAIGNPDDTSAVLLTGNYKLTFEVHHGATIETFPFYKSKGLGANNGIDTEGFAARLRELAEQLPGFAPCRVSGPG